jgi:spermidine synthase
MPVQPKRSTTNNVPLPVPTVQLEDDMLILHFESDYIQSQMVVNEPDFLALAYTRIMMAFEIFTPKPSEIALIGLGGGSIAKWCYRHHPDTKLTVVEINPHVIAVRDMFRIPQVNQRFRILCADGAKFVAKTTSRFDVLLVDCFSTDHLPQELSSQEFYDNCNDCLIDAGLMVVNLCGKPRNILSRIHKSFDGQVLLSSDGDGNTVVFACKGTLLWPTSENVDTLRVKVKRFERKYRLGRAIAPKG